MIDSSPELGALALALSAAQAEMPAVAKDSVNPFFKSKYADLATVAATALPVITKHGLAVSQFVGSSDLGGDVLHTILLHKSGQYLASAMNLHPVKPNDPQAQGSAITYARRYAFMAALGLVADEDDDGNKATGTRPAAKGASKAASKPAPAPREPQTVRRAPPRRPSVGGGEDASSHGPDGATGAAANGRPSPYAKPIHLLAAEHGIDERELDEIISGVTGDPSANSVTRDTLDEVKSLILARSKGAA